MKKILLILAIVFSSTCFCQQATSIGQNLTKQKLDTINQSERYISKKLDSLLLFIAPVNSKLLNAYFSAASGSLLMTAYSNWRVANPTYRVIRIVFCGAPNPNTYELIVGYITN